MLRDGQPDFTLLQGREQVRSPLRFRSMAKARPATYIVFDILYADYQSVMNEPLTDRRARLQKLVKKVANPQMILSDGAVGAGKLFFQEVCQRKLEGMVAKRLTSKYLPGRRTEAWIKVKQFTSILCAIIGFVPEGPRDFESLIVGTAEQGELRAVGKVGSGFTNKVRDHLNQLLRSRLRPKPIVPCKIKGKWVDGGLYCRVRFLERTKSGDFRFPVFEELIEE